MDTFCFAVPISVSIKRVGEFLPLQCSMHQHISLKLALGGTSSCSANWFTRALDSGDEVSH